MSEKAQQGSDADVAAHGDRGELREEPRGLELRGDDLRDPALRFDAPGVVVTPPGGDTPRWRRTGWRSASAARRPPSPTRRSACR